MARLKQIKTQSILAVLFIVSCLQECRASETSNNIGIVTYEEVKDVPNHPYKYLIDVRQPNEIRETGKIPLSINIPIGIVSDELALDVDPDKFRQLYGVEKPNLDSYLIFYCLKGIRSQAAAEAAVKLGYRNVHNYAGAWSDWAKREGLE